MYILNRVGQKFEYENNQKQAKKKKEELDEEERGKYQYLHFRLNSGLENH
jgi:hypothetical protein